MPFSNPVRRKLPRNREPLVSLKREESGLQRQYLQSPPPPHVLVPKNTFTGVFDNTCDMHQRISDFRAHIFCPQVTQELPKKQNEAGPPKQLPADALSQIDYGHTRHFEDYLCQQTTQTVFWRI